jgi:prolyl oligopeptidase
MKQFALLCATCAICIAADAPSAAPQHAATDDYFGVKIVDPYRNLENLNDPDVKGWIKAEADYTRSTLDSLPGRADLLAEIQKYGNASPATISSVTRLAGERYFYLKTLAGQNLAKLYTRQGIDGAETLLIDTDKFKGPHGEPAAINSYVPSYDGKYVAYVISLAGHEIGLLHVLDVAAGKDIGESIDRVWDGQVSWTPDSRSFFFTRLQKLPPGASDLALEENSVTYLHAVGQSPDADMAVFGAGVNKEIVFRPIDGPNVVARPGSDYVIAEVTHGDENENVLYIATLLSVMHREAKWTKICDTDAAVTGAEMHGDDLYLLTHRDASRFKITKTSLSHPDVANAETVVPQTDAVLHGFTSASDGLYVHELDGADSMILRIPFSGSPSMLKLPFDGSVGIEPGEPDVPGIAFWLDTWTRAGQMYLYDPSSDQVAQTDLQPVGPYDQPPDLVSDEVEVTSYDGAKVPLSILSMKNLPLDGNRPTYMIAYGAYGITLDPTFSPRWLAWLRRGGVIAIAHVRGGGEKGEDWHQGGFKLTKPNTWRDTIACAQYLIDQKYTSSQKLGLWGGSAGGITVGRAITSRPDLFAAAVPEVGVMNAVRVELSPNGVPNISEFGTATTQEGFEDLYAMDSYLHIQNGVAYPATLVITGMKDPRVVPWQPVKFAARLQAATGSGKPVLLRVDYSNGHGIGSSRAQRDERYADVYSFFLWQFGDPNFQPPKNP